ncbi:hypothetical protein [Anaerobacillus alkaliphilus]|uniref:hypothetical protein n=1 Tax=Anaerobacillus alkaliphilus TaxID=1548597 RepID=UPI00100A5795|nr:hypothetical protein [Anaerobacillus alkaliphilus]
MRKKTLKGLPFIFLLVIHISLLTYTFYKKENRKKVLIMLLNNIGFAYFFEYIIFTIFNSYSYQPRIVKNKSFDNTIGAIMSQAVFVPMTAVFITSFQLGWKVKMIFSLYFFLIERLFIKLSIFKTNWWRSLYTATLIPIYFAICTFWQKKLNRQEPVVLFTTLVNSLIVINANIIYLLAFFRKIKFGKGHVRSWNEHFVISPLYTFCISLLTVIAVRKNSFKTQLMGVLGIHYLLGKLNIIKTSFPFVLWTTSQILMFYIGVFFKKIAYEIGNSKK